MSAKIELTDAESDFVYSGVKNGHTSRYIADRFKARFSKPMSHTRVVQLTHEMLAEEKEVDAVFSPPLSGSAVSDRAQLAEALAALKQLRLRAIAQRTGKADLTIAALRVLTVEIRALQFKIRLDPIDKEERQPTPGADLSNDLSSSPAHPERTQGASRRTSDLSSNLSTDLSSNLSAENPDQSDLSNNLSTDLSNDLSSATEPPAAAESGYLFPEMGTPEEQSAAYQLQLDALYGEMRTIMSSVAGIPGTGGLKRLLSEDEP